MLEQVREAEIAQAVDRVRPVFNRRKIIVLTNLALDLTVDHALTWPELRPGKFAYAFARHGVLPLSAGDLCRAFPTFGPPRRQPRTPSRYLDKNTLKTPNKYIYLEYSGYFCGPAESELSAQRTARPAGASAGRRRSTRSPRGPGKPGRRADRVPRRAPGPSPRRGRHPSPSAAAALPPLAAALSAEGHLLASLPPDGRAPDMLGMARVIKLMALAAELAGAERAAVA